MRRKSVLYVGGLFLLPLVLAVFMIAQADKITPASAAVGNVVNPTVQPTAIGNLTPAPGVFPMAAPTEPAGPRPKNPKGLSAVKVATPNVATNGSTKGANFSEAEVRQFLKDNKDWGLIRSSGTATISKVEFLTALEVKARIGQDVAKTYGDTDDTLFCLVSFSGNFSYGAGPPLPGQSPSDSKGATFTKAYQLFDAQTGNVLMLGGLGK